MSIQKKELWTEPDIVVVVFFIIIIYLFIFMSILTKQYTVMCKSL